MLGISPSYYLLFLPAKVIFLHLYVILLTGGGRPQCMLGYHTPPLWHTTLAHPPPARSRPLPPGTGTPPRHPVNERPLRILLECILVLTMSYHMLIMIKNLKTPNKPTTDVLLLFCLSVCFVCLFVCLHHLLV